MGQNEPLPGLEQTLEGLEETSRGLGQTSRGLLETSTGLEQTSPGLFQADGPSIQGRYSVTRPAFPNGSLERDADGVVIQAKPRRTECHDGLSRRCDQPQTFGAEDGTKSPDQRDVESASAAPGGGIIKHGSTSRIFQG